MLGTYLVHGNQHAQQVKQGSAVPAPHIGHAQTFHASRNRRQTVVVHWRQLTTCCTGLLLGAAHVAVEPHISGQCSCLPIQPITCMHHDLCTSRLDHEFMTRGAQRLVESHPLPGGCPCLSTGPSSSRADACIFGFSRTPRYTRAYATYRIRVAAVCPPDHSNLPLQRTEWLWSAQHTKGLTPCCCTHRYIGRYVQCQRITMHICPGANHVVTHQVQSHAGKAHHNGEVGFCDCDSHMPCTPRRTLWRLQQRYRNMGTMGCRQQQVKPAAGWPQATKN